MAYTDYAGQASKADISSIPGWRTGLLFLLFAVVSVRLTVDVVCVPSHHRPANTPNKTTPPKQDTP
jgi:hypothetical protein